MGKQGPKIGCTKTITLTNLRLPISSSEKNASMDDDEEMVATDIDHIDIREEMTSTKINVDKLLSDVGAFGR